MGIAKIKRMIGECNSREDLDTIVRLARAQQVELRKANSERAAAMWESAAKARKGQTAIVLSGSREAILICAAEGKSNTAHLKRRVLQPGTMLNIQAVQPRKRCLWAKDSEIGLVYAFTPEIIASLDVRVFPDELTAQVAYAKTREATRSR